MSAFLEDVDRRVATTLTPERRAWLTRPRTLLIGFLLVHLIYFLALLPTIVVGGALGDLPLYRTWAEEGLNSQIWPGLTLPWVYPIGALAPITLAALGGPGLYLVFWFLMTMALNAGAIAALTDFGRRSSGYAAAWWWMLLCFVLSPVALLRLEGITAPLVIIALVLLARQPVIAAVLLTVATWIKVWPVAVLLAIVAVSRHRMSVIATAVVVSAGVVAGVWALDGLGYLTGFITMQSDRALQLEAPVSTPWVWLAALGSPGSFVYQNFAIATREVAGPGAAAAASAMTPLMILAISGVVALILLAKRRNADSAHLLLLGALALSSALVVFNKVGSPQYMLWIAPIIAVGVATDWQRWRIPAYLMLAIGVLTTLIFPVFYLPLIDGDPAALIVLTVRNAMLIVMLGWSVQRLWMLASGRATEPAVVAARVARSAVR
ncbi:hypothetical protein GCM10022381_19470 [Leifsonia kafniensis]|uniref:DUF2029 domain-containing protein n=1 Tax=Leifsonia kafniensis TaxID=475957 RepID=A0ABP7KHP2_9MICO